MSTDQRMALSVIVPCYNEEAVLAEFFRRMNAACEAAELSSYQIILVNDGSSDGTLNVIQSLAQSNHCVVGVDLLRNHGHQLAVTAGLQVCSGGRALIIDADLQDPPELLAEFMAKMNEGYDVVYGQRLTRDGETRFKRLSASLFYRLLRRLSEIDLPLDTGDFRLINRPVIDLLNRMPERQRFLRGMVAWIGGRQIAYEYDRAPRAAGDTKYTLIKMMTLAVDAITGFSVSPLRFGTWMAFVAVLLALLLSGYVLFSYIAYEAASGWASLGIIVLIFSAAQLFSLGIIGEYVGRSYLEQKGRPMVMIREVFSTEKQDDTL